MRAALLLSLLYSLGSAVASPLTKRASFSSPIFAQYCPNWGPQSQDFSSVPMTGTQIANYFVAVTTSVGFDSLNQASVHAFVAQCQLHNVKALLSIGGWTGSVYFSSLLADVNSRNKFIDQIATAITDNYFDGVDIDWEYPGRAAADGNIYSANDGNNLLTFLAALRAKIGPKLITAAVTTNPATYPVGIADNLDFVNLMAYDMNGQWSGISGALAPLGSADLNNIMSSVAAWTGGPYNVPTSKIILGMPSYSVGYAYSSGQTKYNSQGNPSINQALIPPPYANCIGSTCTYQGLIDAGLLSADGSQGLAGYVRYWDDLSQTPYLFNKASSTLVSFDDIQSITAKVNFAVQKGLAGVYLYDSYGFATSTPNVYAAIRSALDGHPLTFSTTPIVSSSSSSISTRTTTTSSTSTSSIRSSTLSTSVRSITGTTATSRSTNRTTSTTTTKTPSPTATPRKIQRVVAKSRT